MVPALVFVSRIASDMTCARAEEHLLRDLGGRLGDEELLAAGSA